MWLELEPIKKKTEVNVRKLAVTVYYIDFVTLASQKSEKHARFRLYVPYKCLGSLLKHAANSKMVIE